MSDSEFNINGDFALVLNHDELRDFLKSDPVRELISSTADEIRDRAGEGYITSINEGKGRCNAKVRAGDVKAVMDNVRNNTLLKAMKK